MGEIVNYMQLDTGRMEYVASSIHVIWDGILQVTSIEVIGCRLYSVTSSYQIIGYTALLLSFLGPSVLAGIAAMIVIIPLNAIFLKK